MGTLNPFQTEIVDHAEEPPTEVLARTSSPQVLKQREESLLDNFLTVLNVQTIRAQQIDHETIAETIEQRKDLRLQRRRLLRGR